MAKGEEVRLGIVGCSRGGAFALVAAALERALVTAVMDVKEEAARRLAHEVGIKPDVFTDYQRFLDEAPVDAVVIASPIAEHVPQSVAALERGLHVLCEVPACHDLESAHVLADASQRSQAIYMFAENCCYMDEPVLVARMAHAGLFGQLLYGEAEYLHDCRYLWRDDEGKLTWRGRWWQEVKVPYLTHSLGPLLEIFNARAPRVSALAYGSSRVFDPEVEGPVGHLLQLETTKGAVFKLRLDHVSPRPYELYYALQGTAGAYEGARGLGDKPKVTLASAGEQWEDLFANYAERFIPERLSVGAKARRGGHGTSEYWMMLDFLTCIREGKRPTLDVYRALDYTVPGIIAIQSAEQASLPLPCPDFRPYTSAS